jgi:hypothetical protein
MPRQHRAPVSAQTGRPPARAAGLHSGPGSRRQTPFSHPPPRPRPSSGSSLSPLAERSFSPLLPLLCSAVVIATSGTPACMAAFDGRYGRLHVCKDSQAGAPLARVACRATTECFSFWASAGHRPCRTFEVAQGSCPACAPLTPRKPASPRMRSWSKASLTPSRSENQRASAASSPPASVPPVGRQR